MNCKKPWKNLFSGTEPKHMLFGTYLLCLFDSVEIIRKNQEVKLIDLLFYIRYLEGEVLIDVYSTTNNINHHFNFPVKNIDLDALSVEQHIKQSHELLGEDIVFLLKGKKDFDILSENWDLDNYVIWFESEKRYISVAFIPKVDTFIDGVPFQISYRGNYKYYIKPSPPPKTANP